MARIIASKSLHALYNLEKCIEVGSLSLEIRAPLPLKQ